MVSKTKKPLSVILCFLLLFTCVCVPASAADPADRLTGGVRSIWQWLTGFFSRIAEIIKNLFRGTGRDDPTEPATEPATEPPTEPATEPPAEPEPLTEIRILADDVVCELKTGEGNPRNSEGDFAVLPDGRILFAYSRYRSGAGYDDDPCDIAGMVSSDGGRTFTALPGLLARAEEHNALNIMSVSLEVLADGTVCLFYLVKNNDGSLESSYVMRKSSPDDLIFGAPVDVIPNIPGDYYVVNNCRTQMLADGRIAVAAARHPISSVNGANRLSYVAGDVVYISDMDVTSFTKCAGPITLADENSRTGLQEPGIQVLPDGTFRLYARTDRGYQYESFSPDGVNWTAPAASCFESPNSPMLIERNPYSGVYYAIWNPYARIPGTNTASGRTPLVIARSRDGIEFTGFTVLEGDPETGFCYPAICFLSENEMLVSYCFGQVNTAKQLSETRIRRLCID